MNPILFDSSPFPISSQVVLIIAAFLAGLAVALREGRRFGFSARTMTDLVLWGFLAALFGARLFLYILDTRSLFFPLDKTGILQIVNGGFSLHGGLLGGGIAICILARCRRISVWRIADALAPGLAIAMLFLRIGCLSNGCDYGVVSSVPWALPLYGELRHPIQLYEGMGNAMIVPLLIWFNNKPIAPGRVCGIYLFLSSCLRVSVDMYRDDPARFWGMTVPQYVAAGIALVAGLSLVFDIREDRL